MCWCHDDSRLAAWNPGSTSYSPHALLVGNLVVAEVCNAPLQIQKRRPEPGRNHNIVSLHKVDVILEKLVVTVHRNVTELSKIVLYEDGDSIKKNLRKQIEGFNLQDDTT